MAFTFKQLKQAKKNMIGFGLSPSEASHVLSVASPDVINAIIDGDMTQVSALLPQGSKDQAGKHKQDQASPQASAGDCIKDQARNTSPQGAIYKDQAGKDQESNKTPQQGTVYASIDNTGDCPQASQDRVQDQDNKPMKRSAGTRSGKKKNTSLPQASHDQLSTLPQDQDSTQATADITQDPAYDPDALPAGLYDDICATIEYYCDEHGISDSLKIHPIQWRSVCMSIGAGIKSRKILFDMEYLKIRGGKKYNPNKVLALLLLYDRICSEYKQVAFMHNFAPFAGVSDEYLNDYMQRDLTSTQCGLRQKAFDMQRASLVGAVTGGGSATVGNIFLSKALAGLQETVTVQHVSATASPAVSALPVFDDLGTLLPDNGSN